MPNMKKPARVRWLLLFGLLFSSVLFTGCEKGSLGVKDGAIKGYVMDKAMNKPLADVLIHASTGAGGSHLYRDAITGGDGSFVITGLQKGTWLVSWGKYGWLATGSYETGVITNGVQGLSMDINNGETLITPLMYLYKTLDTVKGTLKGYPIDSVTGAPLQNFTVSQKDPARQKIFDTAQDFREAGWVGLEGGAREFVITCENYLPLGASITISNIPYDLGVMRAIPESISIAGTLKNLPGVILSEADNSKWIIWAEAGGKVVATASSDAMKSSIVYTLSGIPVTAGTLAVKCKVRGYDVVVINPSVSIPKQRPGGVIAGIDADFANIEPIRRDVRVLVRGSKPTDDLPLDNGEVVRIYVRQGGKDIVPYVDAVASNYYAEGYFSGVPTGWKLDFFAINLSKGYISWKKEDTIPENVNSIYTVDLETPATQ